MKRFAMVIVCVSMLLCCGVLLMASISSKNTLSTPSISVTNSNQLDNDLQSTDVSTEIKIDVVTVVPQLKTPSIEEIAKELDGMTDAQSNRYLDTLKNSRVENWQGKVSEVDEGFLGGFTVIVDMDESSFTNIVTFDVSEDIALLLSKGDTIVFSGDVDYVSDILGLSIHVKNVEIEP